MSPVSKHYVAVQLLVCCVLLVDAGGQQDPGKGYFRRKESPEHEKINPRQFNSKPKANKIDEIQPPPLNNDIPSIQSQTGGRAVLRCNIKKLILPEAVNITVIWIKWQDSEYTLLTDNNQTVHWDKRFLATQNDTNPMDWTLDIRYVELTDEGIYQCHTCSDSSPTDSIFIELKLVEAQAIIMGGAEKVVEEGSPLRLSCVLNHSIEAADYIFWYHGDRMINYDLDDGATVRDGRHGSELIFPVAQRTDAGNYTCVPSNAQQASVEVKVLKVKTYEMDGKGGTCKKFPQDHIVNMLVLISAFHLYR